MKFAFRVDVSQSLGTGHLTRCVALARELKTRGHECHFIIGSMKSSIRDALCDFGFRYTTLAEFDGACVAVPGRRNRIQPSSIGWEQDLERTIRAFGSLHPDWVVVDHYSLDERWEHGIRSFAGRIMVIDDLADRPHQCDVLLDQNLVSSSENRYVDLVQSGTRLLTGPGFALLGPEYLEELQHVHNRSGPVRSILVSLGGSDPYNITELVLNALDQARLHETRITVALGVENPHRASIENASKSLPSVSLLDAVPSLAPYIAKADLGIGAFGSSTWERLCLGLPSIAATISANQREIASYLNGRGLVHWMGDHEFLTIGHVVHALRQALSRDLADWSRRCFALVDGRGTHRVALELERFPSPTP